MFAWMLCVTVTISAARYLKQFWPKTTPAGLRIWFHIHRNVNIFAIVLMLLGLAFIFLGKGIVWKGPWFGKPAAKNLSAGAWHSLFGAISLFLAFIQPFVSLTRGSPQSKNRPIFNWTHRIIGLTGLLLAVITVLITVIKFKVWSSRYWAIFLFTFYLLVLVAFVALAELLKYKKQRESLPPAIAMGTKTSYQSDEPLQEAEHHLVTQDDSLTLKLSVIALILALVFTIGLSIDILVSWPPK
ncbi:hypothetical protein AB6A40_005766 [Gnathostoma spinigerum]|uniref:ascorbate ferrireductase (transmembrane) n=1 Tax=Gnathostoma spinigerum TaxID=75299 RepID=A0ABD6ER72_9BILA